MPLAAADCASGPLLAVHPKTAGLPSEQWVRCWFGVDGSGLRTVRPPAAEAGREGATQPSISIGLSDITGAFLGFGLGRRNLCWGAGRDERHLWWRLWLLLPREGWVLGPEGQWVGMVSLVQQC